MITRQEAIDAMEQVVTYIAKDGRDSHTEGTAKRFVDAWDTDWAEGYKVKFKMTSFDDDGTDQMVCEIDIPVVSHCSHHLAPIMGVAHVAYLPGKTIIGLSKLNRIVEKFSRRLQVQERLTTQIAEELEQLLGAKGVGVQIVAEHMCVSSRGVRHHGARTVTSKLTGLFLTDVGVKDEFFALINNYAKG